MTFYMGEIRRVRKEFFDAYQDGEYKKAVFLGKHLLHIYEENEDCGCMEYAVDMSNLANVFDRMQVYDRAVFYYQKAAELKKQCGGESLSYADTLNNLAIVFNQLGVHEKALELHRQVLRIREKQSEEADADIIYSLYHIGNSYEMLGNYEKAIRKQEQALQRARRCADFSLTDLADLHSALGRLYGEQGNYKKGIYYYETCLDLIEKGRGQESLLYILHAMKLAILCEKADLTDLAIEYGEKALALRRKLFSTNHMDFIKNLSALAILCTHAEKYEKAIPLHREMLEWVERMLGREHSLYADALHYLGMDYAGAGDFSQALELHQEGWQLRAAQYGENSLQAASSLMCMGKVYERMGKAAEALAYFEKALAIRREQKDAAAAADSLRGIGRIFRAQGNLLRAEKALREAVLLREEKEDTPSDAYFLDMELLAGLLQELGEHDAALAIGGKCAEGAEKRFGAAHPRYAQAVGKMAQISMEAGYWDEAAAMLEGAAALQKEMLDEDNPQYLATLELLAEVFTRKGEFAKAIKLYQEKNDVNFEETPEEMLAAANNLLAIANCYKRAGDMTCGEAYFQEAEAKQKRSGIAPDALYERRRQLFFREERERLLDAPPPQVEKGNAADYEKAVEYYSAQALAVREREGETPEFARLLLKTATYHAHLGHRQDTDTLLDRVLLLGAQEGVLTTNFGRLCDRVGRIFAEIGSLKKAEAALRQAYQIQQDTERCMTKEGYALLLRLLRAKNDEKAYLAVKNGEKLE